MKKEIEIDGIKVYNFTPHTITVRGTEGDIVIPPEGRVIRLEEIEFDKEILTGGIHFVRKQYKFTHEGTIPCGYVIVSAMCLPYCPKLSYVEFISPDTGVNSGIRDEEGRILAVRGFIRRTL